MEVRNFATREQQLLYLKAACTPDEEAAEHYINKGEELYRPPWLRTGQCLMLACPHGHEVRLVPVSKWAYEAGWVFPIPGALEYCSVCETFCYQAHEEATI